MCGIIKHWLTPMLAWSMTGKIVLANVLYFSLLLRLVIYLFNLAKAEAIALLIGDAGALAGVRARCCCRRLASLRSAFCSG